jgi:hypothetical protein
MELVGLDVVVSKLDLLLHTYHTHVNYAFVLSGGRTSRFSADLFCEG